VELWPDDTQHRTVLGAIAPLMDGTGDVTTAHVQADEICVRVRGGRVWLAQAMEVGTRFWLGGVVAKRRDGLLVRRLLMRVKGAVVTPAFLLLVDGFAPYVTAARAIFRVPLRTGRVGRPPPGWPAGFLRGPVVKAGLRGGRGIVRRAVVGTEAAIVARLAATRSSSERGIEGARWLPKT